MRVQAQLIKENVMMQNRFALATASAAALLLLLVGFGLP
jgi:hypothetical protein